MSDVMMPHERAAKRLWRAGQVVRTSLRRYRIIGMGVVGWLGRFDGVVQADGSWRDVPDGPTELLFQSGEWCEVKAGAQAA